MKNRSPDAWSEPVGLGNIAGFPADHGFADRDGRRWRPAAFWIPDVTSYPIQSTDLQVVALGEDGECATLPVNDMPYMANHTKPYPALYGYIAELQHRKGRQTARRVVPERENFRRLLWIASIPEITPYSQPQPAEIRYGEHPDHPGEEGFYIGAVHIGNLSLVHAGVRLVPPDQQQIEYFPIPTEQPFQ